jgi:hypothetical protein
LVALIGVGAVIGAIATGGKKSNNNISTTPLTQINTDLPAAGNAAPTTAAPQTVADVGSTITVAGSRSDQLDVTLVAVKPVVATDNFSTPPAGDVFVGAQFLLVNTGSTAFSDAIDNDAVLSDAAGNQFKTDIVESINAGTLFQTPTNIAVGGKALGWIVFDVPKGAVVTQAQFTLDSGTGDSGQWNVP